MARAHTDIARQMKTEHDAPADGSPVQTPVPRAAVPRPAAPRPAVPRPAVHCRALHATRGTAKNVPGEICRQGDGARYTVCLALTTLVWRSTNLPGRAEWARTSRPRPGRGTGTGTDRQARTKPASRGCGRARGEGNLIVPGSDELKIGGNYSSRPGGPGRTYFVPAVRRSTAAGGGGGRRPEAPRPKGVIIKENAKRHTLKIECRL